MDIRKIIKEEINDFDWTDDIHYSHDELIKFIKYYKIKKWKFEEHWGGDLYLVRTKIESLGNLESVGGYLYLGGTPIKSLGNLQSVGSNLYLVGTPISKKYSEQEIRKMVQIDGELYL